MDTPPPMDLDRSLAVVTENTPQVGVKISRAAAAHLVAWDTDQRVRALHESGHVVLATTLKLPVTAADIKGHHGGYTELGIHDDDQPRAETGSRMRDRIVAFLGGQAARRPRGS